MKEIILTQGMVSLVDDIDYDFLNQFKWSARKAHTGDFYAIRNSLSENGKRHTIYMSRQILGLEIKDIRQTDHINQNTLDNRRGNVRICTHQQNNRNRKSFSNTTSQFKGVHWEKQRGKWRAQITMNGKHKHLGYFDFEIDAAEAYNVVAEKCFGEFACLNF